MHVGGMLIFQAPEDGFDFEKFVVHVANRIGYVPRYRQKVKFVPGRLANPVWIDDPDFDVQYHVMRAALPRPGTLEQLDELMARIMARRLDRSRPLWELYLVEGLADNRFAIISKTHHAMVDGMSAVDIGQVLLDQTPEPPPTSPAPWDPSPVPSSIDLMASALRDSVARPAAVVDTVTSAVGDAKATAVNVAGTVWGILNAMKTVVRPATDTPLNVSIGQARRFARAETRLQDYKTIKNHHGGTVNDVALATVAGALRAWLLSRGEKVTASTTVRALVPVSIRSPEARGAGGNQIASLLCDLPVGEADPVIRLSRVTFEMRVVKESGMAVAAPTLVDVAGFAPPTLHSMGARVASRLSNKVFNLLVTNVPGPQIPLYAAGALMLSAFPYVPLSKGQALGVGLTSYNGGMFIGLTADRDAMPDVDVLAQLIPEALEELLHTVS
jgi:WS/DGAT/MGAT family acyltransferase